MQVPGRVAMAAPLGRNDFDHIANSWSVYGLQKCSIVFANGHGVFLFLVPLGTPKWLAAYLGSGYMHDRPQFVC